MDDLSDYHNQFKLQTLAPDMGPFVIELEGRGAVCMRSDPIYGLTSNVQVTGLVSQDGISFFPIASDLVQNENAYVQPPMFINVPIENHANQFILNEEAVAIPLNDVVTKRDFHEIDNCGIADITSGINQFSGFDNRVSVLELADTNELREIPLPQTVIQNHPSCDVVCQIASLPTYVIESTDKSDSLINITHETGVVISEGISNVMENGVDVENSKEENEVEGENSKKALARDNDNTSFSRVINKRGRPKKEKEIEPPIRKGPFICETCNIKVSTWSKLKSHKLTHLNENKPYSCKVCSLSFNIEKNLKIHQLLHNVGNLTCTECNKTFNRFASFKAHLPIHQEEENVFCSECGDEFASTAQLEQHLQKHRSEWKKVSPDESEPKNILSCKACNRMFTNPVTFECHKKDHQRLRSQLLALAPKRKRKRFRSVVSASHGNECSVCKKTFPKPSQLVRHLRTHTGEKPFKCATCSASFSQKGSLQIHMSKHNGYKPHVCSCCSLSFSQRGNLLTHVNKVHRIPKEGEEIYKCSKCPCSFKKLASLNCHVTKFHLDVKDGFNPKLNADTDKSEVDRLMNAVAEIQNNLSKGKDESDILQTAIRISGLPLTKATANEDSSGKEDSKVDGALSLADSSSEVRVVTIADKSDDGSVKHFTVRQRREGNVRWHQCNVCLKEFKKPSDLIRHFRIHTREKPFKCNHCCRTFSIKSTLMTHLKTHLGSKLPECNSCGKKMSTTKSLKIQRSDDDIRPYTCDACIKSSQESAKRNKDLETVNSDYFFEEPFLIVGDGEFQQQMSRREKLISRSQNATSTERPYECEYCQLKFRKSSHLKQHKLQHTGEKPFSCSICQKKLTTNGALKMHLKSHSGQKDFSCDKCPSKFSTKGSLKRHTQTFHSEDRPYMCPYCQQRFKTSVNCRKHIKTHRYDNSQHLYSLKLNEVNSEVLTEDNVVINSVEGASTDKVETSEVASQTLLTDPTGTMTFPVLNQESLTQESMRELEDTLDQEFFGSEQGSEYTVQMISTVEGEKESDFIEPLLSKPLILNADETIREPSIVQAVFSQTEELQTVSNMSEILPDTKDPKSDYGDINESNDKEENDENSFSQKENKSFDCAVCGKSFSSLDTLKIHGKRHLEKREFNCDLCGWRTLTRSSFVRHYSIHNEVKKFACTECPAKFRLKIHLRKHQKLHETPKEDGGSRTGRRNKGPFREFSDAETELLAAQDARHGASVSEKILIESAAEKLRMDEKKNTEEQPEKESRVNFGNDCKHCHKSFKKPSDLIRHVRVHTGERPFQCAQCNKCFRVKSTLSSHLKTHYGAKPVSCHICQSMFAAKSSLKVHMRLHTGAKPFECPICKQRFRTSGHRKNHLLSHAKNKPKAWKKQQLQMLNKIAVALVVNLSEENELNKADLKAVEDSELQQAFESDNISSIQNEADNEALLLQLNDQNNIVQLLSEEHGETEVVPTAEENTRQSMQFQIYTTDGQVYITHPNSDLIVCSDESVESNNEKKAALENAKSEILREEKLENDLTKKKNICHFCQKIFSKKSLLERHLRVHTGERPFACDLCGRRFTQSNALKAHLKAHKGDRAFTCPYCDFSCVQRGNLRIHMSRTHQFAYFLNEDKTKSRMKSIKSSSNLLSDSLLKTPNKSPTTVRTSDIDQVMGELFPQVT